MKGRLGLQVCGWFERVAHSLLFTEYDDVRALPLAVQLTGQPIRPGALPELGVCVLHATAAPVSREAARKGERTPAFPLAGMKGLGFSSIRAA